MNAQAASSPAPASPNTGKIAAIAMAIFMVIGTAALISMIHVGQSELVKNLSSTDSQQVSESLVVLKNRHDPAGLAQSQQLLDRTDPDIARNAAIYLLSFDRREVIPKLIESMKNSTGVGRADAAAELNRATSAHLGPDYLAWHDWLEKHPQ